MTDSTATIIDGKAIAEKRLALLKERSDRPLTLGVVLATMNPKTLTYVEQKRLRAGELGWRTRITELPEMVTEDELLRACDAFNRHRDVDGYIVQLPLPPSVDRLRVFAEVDPSKDADGLTPANLGLLYGDRERIIPATPKGILSLLEAQGTQIAGSVAVVVGKGILTGLPMATLLAHREATVISCDKRTEDLTAMTKQADLLVTATGQAGLITGEMLKPGVTVIDVGAGDGDVDFASASVVAGAITPVPGGVGPMTVVSLLENVHQLAHS